MRRGEDALTKYVQGTRRSGIISPVLHQNSLEIVETRLVCKDLSCSVYKNHSRGGRSGYDFEDQACPKK
ncbi:hypothetical protein CDL15_Pgr011250 [Punica granatum]|nr:hypothetical protein CDL15_Pgr011250 [Punica granatum]